MPVVLSSNPAEGRMIASGRMLAGLDQAALAASAGVSASTISNVERGSDARAETVRLIRRALRRHGVTLSFDRTNGIAIAALCFSEPEDDED